MEPASLIYTTNAIGSLDSSLRRAVKTRGHFPNGDAAVKLLYKVIRNISAKWTMPQWGWKPVLNQFAIPFEGRWQKAIRT